MARRSLLIDALGVKAKKYRAADMQWPEGIDAYEPPAEDVPDAAGAPAPEIDEIFTSIRTGEAPWALEALPADTGATGVLLTELDRLWQNPPGLEA